MMGRETTLLEDTHREAKGLRREGERNGEGTRQKQVASAVGGLGFHRAQEPSRR